MAISSLRSWTATAASLALVLIAPQAAHAASSVVVADDPSGDVVVDGGVMSNGAYGAADIDDMTVENVQGSVLRIDWEVWNNAPGPEATATYEATLQVKMQKPKHGKRPKGYRVVVTLLSDDPVDPLRIASNKSGSMRPVTCAEAAPSVSGAYHVLTDIPLGCIGKKADSATISFLLTAIDTASGARGRDGAKTGPVSLRRGAL